MGHFEITPEVPDFHFHAKRRAKTLKEETLVHQAAFFQSIYGKSLETRYVKEDACTFGSFGLEGIA